MKNLTLKRADSPVPRTVILSLVCGVGAFYAASFVSRTTHAQSSPPSRPVTVDYTIREYDPTGQLRLTKSRLYARFSDGSMANRYTEVSPQQRPIITEILNATTGDWIYLDATTHSAVTLKRKPAKVEKAISESDISGCPSGVDLTKLPQLAPILGLRILYYANTDSMGDMEEKWIAPDLDCLPMKNIDTSPQHGGAHNVEVATSIRIGEPDEDLKTAPPSYTERTPEQVEDMHIGATGGEPFWGRLWLHNIKRDYARNGALAQR